MNTEGFIGNEKIIEQLGYLMQSNRFPHALVIEGEKGLGKLTLARLLACALVCREDNRPCRRCAQCSKAQQGIHPDIFEHCASGAARSFHVDTVRQIINDVYIQPNEAQFKIYILGNADCMSDSAQNAILKVLEEPPSYAVFILTAQSKSSLLDTVLSRSVVVTLDGVDCTSGAKYIVQNMENVDFSDAENAMETFGGNIGKAMESLRDSRTGELVKACRDICFALVNDNEYALMTACAPFQKDRQSVIFAAGLLKNIFRDALFYSDDGDMLSGQRDAAKLLKSKLTKDKLIRLIEACREICTQAETNVNNTLIITKICYCMRRAIGR